MMNNCPFYMGIQISRPTLPLHGSVAFPVPGEDAYVSVHGVHCEWHVSKPEGT